MYGVLRRVMSVHCMPHLPRLSYVSSTITFHITTVHSLYVVSVQYKNRALGIPEDEESDEEHSEDDITESEERCVVGELCIVMCMCEYSDVY